MLLSSHGTQSRLVGDHSYSNYMNCGCDSSFKSSIEFLYSFLALSHFFLLNTLLGSWNTSIRNAQNYVVQMAFQEQQSNSANQHYLLRAQVNFTQQYSQNDSHHVTSRKLIPIIPSISCQYMLNVVCTQSVKFKCSLPIQAGVQKPESVVSSLESVGLLASFKPISDADSNIMAYSCAPALNFIKFSASGILSSCSIMRRIGVVSRTDIIG